MTDEYNSQQEPEHDENWEFYFTMIQDNIASFFVDLGLKKIAPVYEQPFFLYMALNMNNPNDQGLSSQEESEKLFEIEDYLVEALTNNLSVTYVGRITCNRSRIFYFYTDDTVKCKTIISGSMADYPEYEYSIATNEDSLWEAYLDFLYPDPEHYRSIQNRWVVDRLEKFGDDHSIERPVHHWIYFETEKDRDKFMNVVNENGFKQEDTSFDPDDETGYPYMLEISRIDKVDSPAADEYILLLFRLAKEHNGDYDGWETQVVTE